ncbi:MAG: hypothetical protein BroJett013_33390 [Alphaproteobacteria bacterium]|nr:MAG: hypothetical protein BroJett013_33390 [Alphaproteobacteria bacterium]
MVASAADGAAAGALRCWPALEATRTVLAAMAVSATRSTEVVPMILSAPTRNERGPYAHADEPLFNLARHCGRNRADGTPQRPFRKAPRLDSGVDYAIP